MARKMSPRAESHTRRLRPRPALMAVMLVAGAAYGSWLNCSSALAQDSEDSVSQAETRAGKIRSIRVSTEICPEIDAFAWPIIEQGQRMMQRGGPTPGPRNLGSVIYKLDKGQEAASLQTKAWKQSGRRTRNELHSYVLRQYKDAVTDSYGNESFITGIEIGASGAQAALSRDDIVSRFGMPEETEEAYSWGNVTEVGRRWTWLSYDYLSFGFTEDTADRMSGPTGRTARRGVARKEVRESQMRLAAVRLLLPEYLDTYALGADFARASILPPSDSNESEHPLNPRGRGQGPRLIDVRSVDRSRFGPRAGGGLFSFDPNTDMEELSEGDFLYVVIHVIRAPAQWDILNLRVDGGGGGVYAWTHGGMFLPSRKPRQEQPQDGCIRDLATGRLLKTERDVLVIFKGDFSGATSWSLFGRYISAPIELRQRQE